MNKNFFSRANLLGNLSIAIAYFLTAQMGLLLSVTLGNASPVWPPSGISLAAILVGGYQLVPGIWLGAILSNNLNFYKNTGHLPLAFILVGAAIAAGGSLEAITGAFLSDRLIGTRRLFNQGKNVFKFLGIGIICCMVSPTIGVLSLCLGGVVPWNTFGYSWLTWWLGDLAGILVMTPMLVTWMQKSRSRNIKKTPERKFLGWPLYKVIEAAIWSLLLALIVEVAFTYRYPVEYLMLPLLVWAAFRFGQRGATFGIFLVSAIAVYGSIQGVSSFMRATLNESLLLLQAFIGSVTVTTLVLSAVITEREQAEAKLERANEELELRVEQRTAELKDANQEIQALNECLKAENIRMSAELEITRQLQKMILPKEEELSQIPGLEIAGFMEPAAEVGGDYYDVLNQNGLVKIGIGDVTGHGLESGVLMIMVQTAVRTLLANNETDPTKFLNAINQTIYENVQRMKSPKNLTLSLVDYQDGKLRLSGQHEEMIVVRAGGMVERIDTIDLGFPIGLEADIANFVTQIELQLNAGDIGVLYTDGITEAEDINGVLYGIERLCELVSQNWPLSAVEIRQIVIEDVKRHIGKQKVYDDITMVVFKQK